MVGLSRHAERHLDALVKFYEGKKRPDAIRTLFATIARAQARIEQTPNAGLAAPRPYPMLARDGQRWLKEGRYWFRYSLANPPVILGIFFETADIPRRM